MGRLRLTPAVAVGLVVAGCLLVAVGAGLAFGVGAGLIVAGGQAAAAGLLVDLDDLDPKGRS